MSVEAIPDGVLNILKPPGMTSFEVVAFLKKVLGVRKIGHGGTLDPAAAGVLPVCLGRATKAMGYILDWRKTYRAELTLGIETDTQDSSGRVIAQKAVCITPEQAAEAIRGFVGRYRQLPPMFSALRHQGKRLYQLARRGVTVERDEREVEIYLIEIVKMALPVILFDVTCSKGTYIRTLCADIGKRLGCGGHLSYLVRLKTGIFGIEDALTLEEVKSLAEKGQISGRITGVDRLFGGFESMELSPRDEGKFINGAYVPLGGRDFEADQLIRVYGEEGAFLGLGKVLEKDSRRYLKSEKLFQVRAGN